MGTKFTNINIAVENIGILPQILNEGEVSVQLAEDWVSLFLPILDYTKNKTRARNLSRQVDGPVVYTEYFDDDIAKITVLRKGKQTCTYTNEEGRKYFTKLQTWETEFSLDKEDMRALRLMLKIEQDLAMDLDRISALIGAELFMDKQMAEDYDKSHRYAKDKEATRAFLAEQAKLCAIKNHTKVNIVCEQEGLVHQSNKVDNDYVIKMVTKGDDGNYDYAHFRCYKLGRESMECFFEYAYPEEIFPSGSTWAMELWRESGQMEIHAYYEGIFSSEVTVVDGDAFETELYGDKRPLLTSKREYYNASSPVRYRFHHEHSLHHLEKLASDGTVMKSVDLPGDIHCKHPIQAGDRLVCFCWQIQQKTCLVCVFDLNLNLIHKHALDSFYYSLTVADHIYSQQQQVIYFGMYREGIGVYDLETYTFTSKSFVMGNKRLKAVDSEGNLIMLMCGSTLYVIDSQLKILSRHRLKGTCIDVIPSSENGCLRIITMDNSTVEKPKAGKTPKVRIYEITTEQ